MDEVQSNPVSNIQEYSVSELSGAVKATVEDRFGRVRVRGEISQPKVVRSGHCYLRLKDENAVLEAVIWKGNLARLPIRPEEGMEVIASGKLTTYVGQSKYQIVIDTMELAGEGALLKLLEDRRRKLTAEGLFDDARKTPLPFLPGVIGVITSPTGAVIRDILHRLNDRFPRHVMVWPVRVQGEHAAGEISAAIEGFSALPSSGGPIVRPDLVIVARGGGSLEDLWPFNEEAVVRAAATCTIPLISAVGHETDTTLIDFVADRRAPTPTAAAEMAVPVRLDLMAQVSEDGARLSRSVTRLMDERALALSGLIRGLPDLGSVLAEKAQRLDDRSQRLDQSARTLTDALRDKVAVTAARLRHPREVIGRLDERLTHLGDLLRRALIGSVRENATRLAPIPDRLSQAAVRIPTHLADRLSTASERLEAVSHASILARGFALVRRGDGTVISRVADAKTAGGLSITFADGDVSANVGTHSPRPAKTQPKSRLVKSDPKQGKLL